MATRRKLLIALGAGALAAPFGSFAQQQGKVWRIGVLGAATASGYAERVDALRDALRKLGYEEGKNLVFEFRWAEGKYERLPALAAELVRLKVDVIVTHGTPGSRAAKQATTFIPIVMASVGDPVASGLVASLARPGGNITGATFFSAELQSKRIELLKDIFPKIKRVGVLTNPGNVFYAQNFQSTERSAKAIKVALTRFDAREAKDLEGAIAAMAKRRIEAFTVDQDGLLNANNKVIADIATGHRLPSIGAVEFADAGGLIGFGRSGSEWGRAATLVDKILRGTKPADIPVEQAIKFEIVINMKTAKALGVKLPESFMQRADRLIQ